MRITEIEVRAESAYRVLVGVDVLGRLPEFLGEQARRVAVIHAPCMTDRAEGLRDSLRTVAGLETILLAIPDAEAAKGIEVASSCWEALGSAGFTRSDAIVSLGGGATTDLAGFVAATWLRGVRVIHIPTTLLAMVDAAVGGKTGINTQAGKNLVGVIHEPAGVLCDLAVLTSLPEIDLIAGMAEVVKAGFIADPLILDVVGKHASGLTDPAAAPDNPALREVVERAIRVKADVVAGDLRETSRALGGREILNYGHTLGHAIEKVSGFRWRHGEAVSVGMVFAAELSRMVGRLDAQGLAAHREYLGALGLPVSYSDANWQALLDTMAVDKKARGSSLRFVVLDRIGHPGFLDGPDPSLLRAAFERLAD